MVDPYENYTFPMASHPLPIDAPAEHIKAVTPSDTEDLPQATRGIYVGVSGDVKVDAAGSGTEIFVGIQGILPVRVKKIYATGTTATNIIGLR